MPIYNDELTNNKFKISYWYVTHRVMLRKLRLLLLLAVAGGLLLYGIWGIFDYYVLDKNQRALLEQEISRAKLNYTLLSEINQPKDLQILNVNVFKKADAKLDLVSEIFNPNIQWFVSSFDYYFLSGEQKTPIKTDFILPGQTKLILYLNFASDKSFSNTQLIIENIRWQKVANYQALADKMLKIEFANQSILSSRQSGASGKEPVVNVRFDVINKSAYSFWEPRFNILLYKAGTLVGATRTVLDSLSSNEIKTVDLNIFQTMAEPTKFEVVPDINILDSSVFKGFGNETGEAK